MSVELELFLKNKMMIVEFDPKYMHCKKNKCLRNFVIYHDKPEWFSQCWVLKWGWKGTALETTGAI